MDLHGDVVMSVYFAAMSFLLGAICGSFFNVCIYRVPAKKSIVYPGSHCYSCGTLLAWYDNIPIVSYFLLRGTCRYCGGRFGIRYAMVELLTGLLFLALFWRFGLNWVLLAHCVFVSLLIVGTFTDIDHFVLPNGITIGGFYFAIAAAAVLGRHSVAYDEYLLSRDLLISFQPAVEPARFNIPFGGLIWSLLSAAFGYALLAGIGLLGRILFRKEAMGGGDIKLFAFLGAYLGALNCIWILFLSAILGSCFGLTLIIMHKLLYEDAYETIELLPDRLVNSRLRNADSQPGWSGQRDVLEIAQTIEPAAKSLKIARSTSRQLHHFPFGPYIAVAAVIVLLFHDSVNRYTRELLFLPPASKAVAGSLKPDSDRRLNQ
jgi:leader peptidase (prepilin peptidase)/N-methyltransferase